MKKNSKKKNQREVTLDGMMTIGKSDNNLYQADFQCCEDVEVETFIGRFKVQGMRDGNVYMEELPKRVKNKPLFRLDNSSFSLGRDGWYYYLFRLPESELKALPELLMKDVREAVAKIIRMYLNGNKR
jgi:hypothetical protein